MKTKPSSQKNRKTTNGGVVFELKAEDSLPALALPFKLENIMVPIDFSECSTKALQYAVPFAKEFKSAITLIHIAEFQHAPSQWNDLVLPLIEQPALRNAEGKLAAIARREIGSEILWETLVWRGNPVPDIIQAAKDRDVDLIVVSTHGRTDLKTTVLGSTTERIVRHAPCPVLVVREKEHEFIYPRLGSPGETV